MNTNMKCGPILLSILTLLGLVTTQRAEDLPKRFTFDRYAAMVKKSPFAVATAAAAPAATPNFAKDLYVANAARAPEADYVTLVSATDKNMKEYLSTKGPNEHGYSIGNIEWSDRPGGTKVTISKDGQFATLPFNQALLSSAPSGGGGGVMPPGVQNPVPQAPAGYPPKAAMPNLPTPVPHTRGMIQRNPPEKQQQPVPPSNMNIVPPES